MSDIVLVSTKILTYLPYLSLSIKFVINAESFDYYEFKVKWSQYRILLWFRVYQNVTLTQTIY